MADREQKGNAGRSGADAGLAGRIAVLEERLAELEAQDGLVGPLERLLGEAIPPEARDHMRAARKEQLLAARSFLDHWIERLDRKPMPRERRRRESIPLE
jgi:hypothetical protein